MAAIQKYQSLKNPMAMTMKAMGHPARIAILHYLMINGPSTCQDIVGQFSYSQSTVSGHLQKLKDGKLIGMKSVGTSSVYTIDRETIEQLSKDMSDIFNLRSEKKQMSLF